MMNFVIDPALCTGCSACFSAERNDFAKAFTRDARGTVLQRTKPPVRYRKNWKGRIFDILPEGVRRILMKGDPNGK